MSTNNNCGVIAKETPVCKFNKKLIEDHALHIEGLVASQIKIDAWEIVRAYAVCSLAKYEETFEYYRDLTNFELFDMKDSAEIIKTNVDNYVQQDTALGKLITDTSKLLNDLQVKLHDANNAACAMRNCLQSILGFSDHDVPKELKDVTDLAKDLSKDGKDAAHTMVTVAGIHTYSNLEKLQPFGSDLKDKLTALKGLTDSLITTAKSDQEKSQTELLAVLKSLNAQEFESYGLTGVVNAEHRTLEFICEGQCVPIDCVEEICRELGSKESEAGHPTRNHLQGDMD